MERRHFLRLLGIGALGLSMPQMPFDRALLAQERDIEKKLETEVITHISGSRYSWKALYNGDYAPLTNDLFNTPENNTENIVTGGFDKDPKILIESGTYTNKNPLEKRRGLIKRFENKIDKRDKKLLKALEGLLEDNSSYIIIKQFLKDGGRIESWPNSGKYDKNALTICVGTDGTVSDVERILYHEALHYAFDKTDSVLSEAHDSGGADHKAISPLEDRLKIIQQIRDKQIPVFDKDNSGLYGFTKDGKLGEKIKEYSDDNNLEGLKGYINSERFQRGYVRSAMVYSLSSNQFYDHHKEGREKMYRLSDGQIRDIAFLNAMNGAIIQNAINIGISISESESIEIKEAFKTKEFEQMFQRFLSKYITGIETPGSQPYKQARDSLGF